MSRVLSNKVEQVVLQPVIPTSVNLEVSARCNLKCPSCAVGNFAEDEPSKGINKFLSPLEFAKILVSLRRLFDSNKALPRLYLYSWGEPFLNPDLQEIVHTAKRNGFFCGLSTNLNLWKRVEDVLDEYPDELVVSLSGLTKETYELSHTGGNANIVRQNLEKLGKAVAKREYRTEVKVNYHIYRHNFGDVSEVAEMCDRLKFSFMPTIAYYMPVENLVRSFNGDKTFVPNKIAESLIVPLEQQQAIAAKGLSSEIERFGRESELQTIDHRRCSLIEERLDIDVEGVVRLCCATYTSGLIPEKKISEYTSLDEIRSRRLEASICQDCKDLGCDRVYLLKDRSEWIKYLDNVIKESGEESFSVRDGEIQISAETESNLLQQLVESTNSGNYQVAENKLRRLRQVEQSKYGDGWYKKIMEGLYGDGSAKAGLSYPQNPVLGMFLEGVLLRNYQGKQLEAKVMFEEALALNESFRIQADSRLFSAELKKILEEWIKLPAT